MNKIRTLLLVLVMVLGLGGAVQIVSAAEAETEASAVQTEPAEDQTEAVVKKGWVISDGYRYYYTGSGKLVKGWTKIDGNYYYFRKIAKTGKPAGAMLTGVAGIYGKYYYFGTDGILKTGWQKIGSRLYYFATTGKPGVLGARYTGVKQIGSYTYRFNKNGSLYTGWYSDGDDQYYYSKKATVGKRGRMLTGWVSIGSYRYYFNSKGVMQKNCWISNAYYSYYLDSSGHKLTNCVTPDGYLVDSKGRKVELANGWVKLDGKYYYYVSGKKVTGWKTISGKRYYFKASGVRVSGWLKKSGYKYYLKSGVMQTGWQTIGGKMYYFGTDGKMAVSTEVDGYTIDANGVADPNSKKASVLIIAGHGQGDCGAIGQYTGKTYYEADLTREFATLIYTNLKKAAGSNFAVTMYDQDYNFYSVNVNLRQKNTVTGPMPDLESYDYVLEIHFNATGGYLKDSYGNGSYKGIGMYVNSAKTDTQIDAQIVQAAASVGTGFKIWAGGVAKSSTLYNAKICQGLGVSYGLLETAFIDDLDDINFYNKYKNQMAAAIAKAIVTNLK